MVSPSPPAAPAPPAPAPTAAQAAHPCSGDPAARRQGGRPVAPGLGLGVDVGGTQTRWALARCGGPVLAEGMVGGFSGQDALTESGRARIAQELQALAAAASAAAAAAAAAGAGVQRVWAGVTGFDAASGGALGALFATALGLPVAAVCLHNDVELACRLCFAPGAGYLVYAGTGSIAAFVDAAGQMHRVGGRGGLLGDEGSGWWIARESLAAIWRREDEQPGSLAASPLGGDLLRAMGHRAGGTVDDAWDATRRFIHLATRGEFGRLALVVAAAAEADPLARQVLERAGAELARLAMLLVRRHGPRPIVLAGRAAALHPLIVRSLRQALSPGLSCELRQVQTHRLAAERACG